MCMYIYVCIYTYVVICKSYDNHKSKTYDTHTQTKIEIKT